MSRTKRWLGVLIGGALLFGNVAPALAFKRLCLEVSFIDSRLSVSQQKLRAQKQAIQDIRGASAIFVGRPTEIICVKDDEGKAVIRFQVSRWIKGGPGATAFLATESDYYRDCRGLSREYDDDSEKLFAAYPIANIKDWPKNMPDGVLGFRLSSVSYCVSAAERAYNREEGTLPYKDEPKDGQSAIWSVYRATMMQELKRLGGK